MDKKNNVIIIKVILFFPEHFHRKLYYQVDTSLFYISNYFYDKKYINTTSSGVCVFHSASKSFNNMPSCFNSEFNEGH